MIVKRIRVSGWFLSVSIPIWWFNNYVIKRRQRVAIFIFKTYVIAGESGDSRGELALLIDVVSAFFTDVGDGLALFSAAALTSVDGSAEARLFFECRFS